MGKLIKYLTILIFIDLFFIATGQICSEGTCSLGSTLFNAILTVGDLTFTDWFGELIGSTISVFNSTTGFLALFGTAGVIVGAFVTTKEFRILLIPITFTLALITADLVFIGAYLKSINPVLALFIMTPISILYVLTVVEWFIGKD